MKVRSRAFVHARIFTSNELQPWVEALFIRGNRIVAVGSDDEILRHVDADTEIVDAAGHLVLPGFIDCHTHLLMGGASLLSVDLSKARSQQEFVAALNDYVGTHRRRWVTGGVWNQQNWTIPSLPRKEWIDSFSEETPVFVSRMDYHMALANSCALNLAGVSGNTPDPPGGLIERDPNTGNPTGILKDRAIDIVQAVIPPPSDDDMMDAGLAALAEARRYGVTSVHDIEYRNDFRSLQRLQRDGKLTCRIYARLPIESCEHLVKAEFEFGFGSDLLRIGSLKGFADGSLGSGTALFFDPYNDDTSSHGLAMETLGNGKLREWALLCDRNALQLSIHAIGDRANAMVLDIFQEVTRANPSWDRRMRIEHAQHVRREDFHRFADLHVIVSAQPYHLHEDGPWAAKKIGPDRLATTYAFRSFLNAGVSLCFGSDWPVVTLNPLRGIYAAVTRSVAGGALPGGFVPEEKLTVEEAVKCYTSNAAFAAFQEKDLGSIEPGKIADIVILSENIFEIPPDRIKEVTVLTTVFDGDIVYEDPSTPVRTSK